MKKKRVALYARVSTKEQNEKTQIEALESYCKQKDWQVVQVFKDKDHGDNNDRKEYKKLIDFAYKGKCDVVMVWKFDRFARSTKELITYLDEFHNRNVDFVSYTENIDTTSPMGKALFTIISAMAELELNNIRQRIKAGMERAKEKGTKTGNRIGTPLTDYQSIRDVIRLKKEGSLTPKMIQKRVGVSKSTYYKILNSNEALVDGKKSDEEICDDFYVSPDLLKRIKAATRRLVPDE